ncbi:MAG: radical SAM protein [Candidatus Lokiarchaeota archaeon]|nr:radical SAM protein [Candidatus Lokiarchaeota archaeon]
MLNYEGSIWRPPSEARSLILQATVGCSHNACTFCISYKKKKYRVRGVEGIKEDLSKIPNSYLHRVRRVFLADGNALAVDVDEMQLILAELNKSIPNLERVGTYAYAKDVDGKTVEDLKDLKKAGLGIVYLGLETGDDQLLEWVRKGLDSKKNIDSCLMVRKAGIPLSLTIILGLGGLELSERHAKATAEVLNKIDPEYVGALTLMIPEGTPLHSITQRGEFKPMSPSQILSEMKILVQHLNLTECIFRTNHASNYLPVRGTLNRDKQLILDQITAALNQGESAHLRTEYMRGL